MNLFSPRLRAASLTATLALSAVSTTGLAQPCALEVKAFPKVVLPGGTARVDVSARYPAGAYAFAASSFDVSASIPWWASVTDGAIAGGDVLGIESGQPHQPALGVLADPQQPYHAWTGRFRPATDAPALVSFKATPSDFWYYPSMLTSSSAPCTAAGGEAWVFVNPVRSGKFAAAPGRGGSVRAVSDGFAAASRDGHIVMGLLLPAVQLARESVVHTGFDLAPTSFSTTTEVSSEVHSFNFTKITFTQVESDESYVMDAVIQGAAESRMNVYLSDGSVRTVSRGVDGSFPVRFDRIPDTMATKVTPQPSASRPEQIELLSWSFSVSDSSGSFAVELPDGTQGVCHGVTVVAYARVDGVGLMQNNLRQMSIGAHYYESTGASRMIVSPSSR